MSRHTALLRAMLTASTIAVAGCSGAPVSPSTGGVDQALTVRLETPHLVFHYSPGDVVDAARAEAFHEWAVSFLDVNCPKKVDYYKFKDRAQQYELTQRAVTGWALGAPKFEVWTYMPFMNHEQFHLYSTQLGVPTTFFVEGIAVAYQVDPLASDYESREKSGEPVHDVAREYRRAGRLAPVAQIVDNAGWNAVDFTVTYIEGGSFLRFVADTYGLDRIKQVFRTIGNGDSGAVVAVKFHAIYGISLAEAEKRWLAFLDGER